MEVISAPTSSTGTPARAARLRPHHPSARRRRRNMVILELIGPVAGFSPWNFLVTQAVRKNRRVAGGRLLHHHQVPEDTPGSPSGFVSGFTSTYE